MAKDERLLPLPKGMEIQFQPQEAPASYAPVYEDEFNEGRSIREYLNVIFKRLWLILTLVVLSTAAVSLYMYKQQSIFLAQTTILIQAPKQRATSKESININFGQDQQYWATQIRLLQNRELMKTVVAKLGLYRDASLLKLNTGGLISTLRSMISGGTPETKSESSLPILTNSEVAPTNADEAALTPDEQKKVELISSDLLANMTVEPYEKTSLVALKITHTNPELAAKVADAVAVQFIESDAKREIAGTEKTLEDLTKSIGELQSELATKELERVNYMMASGMSMAEKGTELTAGRLQTMSGQWLSAEDERRKLQGLYDAAVRAKNSGEIYSVAGEKGGVNEARSQNRERVNKLQDQLKVIDEQIVGAESKLSQLLVKYTEEYQEVQAVRKQLEKLQAFRSKTEINTNAEIEKDSKTLERGTEKEILTGLSAQLKSAQTRETELRNSYQREMEKANQQGQSATRWTTLSSEIDTKRILLNTLTSRQKEVELAINTGRPDNIKITSKASKPTSPIGPNRPRNVMVAFLVSLVAGIGLAFLLDYLDDSIRTSDEVGRSLGLPTLALIPHTSVTEKSRRKLLPGALTDEPQYSPSLVSLNDNRSATAEAYRHLRTSLLFSSAGKPPQTILITSSQPSEGKTTTAMNTAITLAQGGVDVVIIDCDLRRPRLHQHFNLENSHGLTNYLSGEKNPDNLLKPCPRLENLKVITSGPIPPNPTELLSSNEMKTLLTFLRGNFKHIIIDSPPAISFTDAAILSTLADGVVIVAMAGKSSTQLIKRFKQRLNNLGARIFGVVLNGIKPNSLEYGYYGYGYSQYYDYNDPTDKTTPLMEDGKNNETNP